MNESIEEIVRRTIQHAESLAERGNYNWTTSREALVKILADLEVRAPTSADKLAPLRAYIEKCDHEMRSRGGA